MSSTRVRFLVALVGVPIGLVFLWLAVRGADLHAVWETVRSARIGWVVAAVCAYGGFYALQSIRWRRIAATPTVGIPRFVEMNVSGVAVNNVLPGRIGDFLRARWLGLAARMPAGKAFGTVVLDRVFDLVVLVGLLVVGISAVASSQWLVELAAAGTVLLLGFVALLLFSRTYIDRRGRDRRERSPIRRLVRDAVERLAEPLRREQLLTWMALSLAAWALWATAALLVARSLDLDLSLADALFVTAVLNLGSAVPVLTRLRRDLRVARCRGARPRRHRQGAGARVHHPSPRDVVRPHHGGRSGRARDACRRAAPGAPARSR